MVAVGGVRRSVQRVGTLLLPDLTSTMERGILRCEPATLHIAVKVPCWTRGLEVAAIAAMPGGCR